MYYGSVTVVHTESQCEVQQMNTAAAAYAAQQVVCRRHARILNVWCHIRNLTLSFDAYLLEEQSCRISPRSDLNQQSLWLF